MRSISLLPSLAFPLLLLILLTGAYAAGPNANTTFRDIYVTPFDPMVVCKIGDSKLASDLNDQNPNDVFHGYDIDLIYFIADLLKWQKETYRFNCVKKEEIYNYVKNDSAFLGAGAIAITSEKMNEGFEFSLPTVTAGLKLAVKARDIRDLWSFLLSFDKILWGMIFLTTVLTGLISWLFEDQTFSCKSTRRCRTNLKEMMWQAFSSLFYTSEIRLQKFSARVIFLCFWFMVLVLTATYTADLTTKISSRNPNTDWRTIDEASNKRARLATLEVYAPLLAKYNLYNLKTYPSNDDGIDQITTDFNNGDIDGFLLDGPVVDKHQSMYPCTTFVVSDPVVNFNYGYVYPPGTDRDFIRFMDLQVFIFKESTRASVLNKKFIYVYAVDQSCTKSVKQLSFKQLAGLWVILGGTVIVAILLHIIDVIYTRRQQQRKGDQNDGGLARSKTDAEKEHDKEIEESFLMVSDYIHIPSKDLHLRIEDDIKKCVDKIEKLMKDRFIAIEKRVHENLTKQFAEEEEEEDGDTVVDDPDQEMSDFLTKDVDEKVVYEAEPENKE